MSRIDRGMGTPGVGRLGPVAPARKPAREEPRDPEKGTGSQRRQPERDRIRPDRPEGLAGHRIDEIV
ncbi:MAG: hypothetical protein JJT85_00105 [Chromatiales bacterium]|nr:hypothetical protein [Chromatiales bacterium]